MGAPKMKPQDDKTNSRIISLRLDEKALEYLDAAKKVIQNDRGPGSNSVTKTETVKVLMQYGMQVFNQKYGDPMAQKKPKKS